MTGGRNATATMWSKAPGYRCVAESASGRVGEQRRERADLQFNFQTGLQAYFLVPPRSVR